MIQRDFFCIQREIFVIHQKLFFQSVNIRYFRSKLKNLSIMKKINYLILFVLFLSSCMKHVDPPFVIVGKGPVLTDEVIRGNFNTITSSLAASVNIFESDEHFVNVTMEENLFSYLDANIYDGILSISFEGYKVKSSEGIVIDIYTPFIESFSLSGAGDVYSEIPIEEISLTGTGKVKCTGETEATRIYLSGVGDFDLYSMAVSNAYVKLTGTGDVKVNVEEYLEVNLSGIGTVYYKGNPLINKEITGIGEIVNVQ